jgi:metal-responsive CopG/Arc/MetJ family transcriptional regulator
MTRINRAQRPVFDIVIPSPKKVVSIKLEVDLLEEIDRLWRSLGYTSRSEFIREALIYYMQVVSNTSFESAQQVGVIENNPATEIDDNGDDKKVKDETLVVLDTATDIA